MKLRLLPILLFPLATAHADTFGSGANTFTMDFVAIGNANNAADDTGYGSVGYTYRMGVNEVSRGMINAYNALSGGPTLTMFDMTSFGGNGVNRPATGVSWNEAARFVNWLNTSSGYSAAYKFTTSGFNDNIALWTISDSGYNAANPFRNANTHYYLPSEDEWYKAAYYDPNKSGGAGYWNYATGSDTEPTAVASGTTGGTVVYDGQPGPADITSAGGLSAYGTMAQNGNVWEWGESSFTAPNDSAGGVRVIRGGSWPSNSANLAMSFRALNSPAVENSIVGFRVAAVPGPSAFLITSVRLTEGGATVALKFNSEVGQTYRVETSPTLAAGTWADAGVSVKGDGSEQGFNIPTAGLGGAHFFRVTAATATPPAAR